MFERADLKYAVVVVSAVVARFELLNLDVAWTYFTFFSSTILTRRMFFHRSWTRLDEPPSTFCIDRYTRATVLRASAAAAAYCAPWLRRSRYARIAELK